MGRRAGGIDWTCGQARGNQLAQSSPWMVKPSTGNGDNCQPGTIQSERASSHDDDTETEHRLTTATETMNNDSSDKLVDVIWAS